MSDAVKQFINVGIKHSQKSENQEFVTKVASANENLTILTDQLLIVVHRFESGTAPDNIKQILCQAAKDVLQGVLKVLLAIDDFHVKDLLQKADLIQSILRGVNLAEDYSLIKKRLAHLAATVMSLRGLLFRRGQNLCSKDCRDQLTIWGNVLQSNIRLLHQVTRTCTQYPGNVSAKASYDSVQQEIMQACEKIKQLLTFGPDEDDTTVSFVRVVDKVMDALTEAQCSELNEDFESEIVTLVQHSMAVAHYTHGVYKDVIVASCHRILQLKSQLAELNLAIKESPTQRQMRFDFSKLCEKMLDEVCDLEKHVNMTLLQLIIETFLSPAEEVLKLKKVAFIQNAAAQYSDPHMTRVSKFTTYTEHICHIATLVAASSTDSSKVREILTAVKGLESIDPEITPAVVMNCQDPSSRSSNKHLNRILERWLREVKVITDAIDTIVDPRVLMDMSESLLAKEIEEFKKMVGGPQAELVKFYMRVKGLVERPMAMAERLVDENSDPIYRNGLRCFVQALAERVSEADVVCRELLQTAHPNTKQFDTVERRLAMVQESLRGLRDGLDARAHPHLLSHQRLLFKYRPTTAQVKLKQERKKLKNVEAKKKTVKADLKLKDEWTEKPDPISKTAQEVSAGASWDVYHGATPSETPGPTGYKKNNHTPAQVSAQSLASGAIQSEYYPQVSNPGIKTMDLGTDPQASNTHRKPKMAALDSLSFPGLFQEKELEGGPTAEIFGLVKNLVSACGAREQKLVHEMTHSLLSWTNHVTENAAVLMAHCPNITREKELTALIQEVDRTAPVVIQRAKFVCGGEGALLQELLVTGMSWAQQLDRARLIIDVTTDLWLVMASDVRQLVEQNQGQVLKEQMSALTNAKKEMCHLLERVTALHGNYLDNGTGKLAFLAESQDELENLTLTIQTSVEVAAVSVVKTTNDWWQLGMASRDWSVLMTCAQSEVSDILSKMENLGEQRLQCLQGIPQKDGLRIADILEKETNDILEQVDCVVLGDGTLKLRSDVLVAELQAALAELWAVARQPVKKSEAPLSALFCGLKLGAAKIRYIELALDLLTFVRNNCYEYMGFPRQCLLDARDVTVNSDLPDEVKTNSRQKLSTQLLEKSNDLKQKALKAIQTCPDLGRRAIIRSTLDTLAKLTSDIDRVIRDNTTISEADIESLSEHWAARMKKLLVSLKKMEGVRPSTVAELENLNRGQMSHVPSGNHQLQRDSLGGSSSYQNVRLQQHSQITVVPHQPPHLQQQYVLAGPHHSQGDLLQLSGIQHQRHLNQSQGHLQPQQHLQSKQRFQPQQHSHPQHLQPQQILQQQQHIQPQLQPQQHLQSQLHVQPQEHLQPQPLQPQHHLQPQQHLQLQQHLHVSTSMNQQQQHFLSDSSHQPHQRHPDMVHLPATPLSHKGWTPGHELPNSGREPSHSDMLSPSVRRTLNLPQTPQSAHADTSISTPMGKSVNVLLSDAQYLGQRLNRWHDKMGHVEGHERSKVVKDALEMARLCSDMAMFTRGQGPFKNSEEVIGAAVAIVNHSHNIEAFASRLLTLAGQNWLADHLKMCIMKINGCSTQLHIIATALHNSPKSYQGDRILVRNASNLLTTVRQMFALVESIAAMGIQEPGSSDELTKEIISLLVNVHLDNERYIQESRNTSEVDELGLRRVEFHSPPSLASLVDFDEPGQSETEAFDSNSCR